MSRINLAARPSGGTVDPNDPALRAAFVAPRQIALRPLTDYLAAGQALPNDGVADATVPLQAAMDDLVARAVADPSGRYVLSVPAGRYRTTASLRFRRAGTAATIERVGIKGAGMEDTVFLPEGNSSGFVVISPGPTVAAARQHYYADFTVDLVKATQAYFRNNF